MSCRRFSLGLLLGLMAGLECAHAANGTVEVLVSDPFARDVYQSRGTVTVEGDQVTLTYTRRTVGWTGKVREVSRKKKLSGDIAQLFGRLVASPRDSAWVRLGEEGSVTLVFFPESPSE